MYDYMFCVGVRFSSLRYIELPCELITIPVLHELANKCQVSTIVYVQNSSATYIRKHLYFDGYQATYEL